MERDSSELLKQLLADYCNCSPDEITGYAVGVEFVKDNELNFNSARLGPYWRIPGFTDQIIVDMRKDAKA